MLRRDDLAGELAPRYPDAPAHLDREVESLWDSLIGRGLLDRELRPDPAKLPVHHGMQG